MRVTYSASLFLAERRSVELPQILHCTFNFVIIVSTFRREISSGHNSSEHCLSAFQLNTTPSSTVQPTGGARYSRPCNSTQLGQ